MIRPDKGRWAITQLFGQNKYKFGYGPTGHDGVDLGAPSGSPVYAPRNGVVVDCNTHPAYGKRIKINNGKNIDYAGHLSVFLVKVGQKVKEGQLIAKSGATGAVTGPHIHWGVYTFKTATPIDPLKEMALVNKKPVAKPKVIPKKLVTYTVKRGDWLLKIALAFHTTLARIKKLNPKIKNLDDIDPGDKIRIRKG